MSEEKPMTFPVFEYKISAIVKQGYAIDLTFISERTDEDEIKDMMMQTVLKEEFKVQNFLEKPISKEDFVGWKIKKKQI